MFKKKEKNFFYFSKITEGRKGEIKRERKGRGEGGTKGGKEAGKTCPLVLIPVSPTAELFIGSF